MCHTLKMGCFYKKLKILKTAIHRLEFSSFLGLGLNISLNIDPNLVVNFIASLLVHWLLVNVTVWGNQRCWGSIPELFDCCYSSF
jgi:hypothetical protein